MVKNRKKSIIILVSDIQTQIGDRGGKRYEN